MGNNFVVTELPPHKRGYSADGKIHLAELTKETTTCGKPLEGGNLLHGDSINVTCEDCVQKLSN